MNKLILTMVVGGAVGLCLQHFDTDVARSRF